MKDSDAPSEAEQDEAWEYVCKRELIRPSTKISTVLKYVMIFIFMDISISSITFFILKNHPIFVFFGYTILGVCLLSKKIIIGLVHLYQHYAPERIRRKCIFKPTCSEYMILALQKYGLFKGLYKSIYRMFFRCSGFYYSIDYP